MKTKNYTLYFGASYDWLDWALPLRIAVEYWHRDYTEIWLQILCFNFDCTRISHKYGAELDNMFKGEEGND